MRGGKRPNTGPKKGTKYAKTTKTLLKEQAREVARIAITAKLLPMIERQIVHAMGIDHFFLRDEKTKQFVRVTDPKTIETALNCGDKDSYYWIFTKDPSVQAFTDLMNRALDKPAEQVKVTGADNGPVVFKWQE